MVSRKRLIYKFPPFLDESELLRVKDRIDEAREAPADLKGPILLPRNIIITHLITEFYHRRFHHQHKEIVVNEVWQRSRLWLTIIGEKRGQAIVAIGEPYHKHLK